MSMWRRASRATRHYFEVSGPAYAIWIRLDSSRSVCERMMLTIRWSTSMNEAVPLTFFASDSRSKCFFADDSWRT